MKKHFLLFIALFAASLFVMAEMTIYVYKKDGTKVPYIASAVDSIGFVDVTPPEAVDLGLPSGTKWANMNVGANKPEDFGDYFAWGETTPKSSYTSSNYSYSSNPTTLPLDRDAAYTNWGTSWRMPTDAELEELKDNCTWTWTTQNGVKGYKVTSKTNGNSIFLPAAGCRVSSDLYGAGSNGNYWSSWLLTHNSSNAYDLGFNSNNVGSSNNNRLYGQSVRPVLADVHTITFNANGGEGNMDVFYVKDGESVTLPANTFTNDLSTFVGWNTAADGSGTAYTDQSTITPTANMTLYAQWEAPKDTGIADGHEWVDLGLPSGTKWASTNVGANSPEDFGYYFAWGETESKSTYNWSTYKWCRGSSTTLTKYCTSSSYGTVYYKTTLELSDDAAYVNWGTFWRMPTDVEIDELKDTSYTTWIWTTQNGVKGYKVTSKTNGNSIFLPAAGTRGDSDLINAGSNGFYWSSSLSTGGSNYAFYLTFNSDRVRRLDNDRLYGHPVRPVLRE